MAEEQMDFSDVLSEVMELRQDHLIHSFRDADLVSLPPAYADALWSWWREHLDPEERAAIEAGDGHPVEAVTLYGMTVTVDASITVPQVTSSKTAHVIRLDREDSDG
jgi:hypothetical protein